MTSPATFGEFLDAARLQLSLASLSARPADGEDLRDVGQGLRRLVLVLARYAQDAATGFGTWPDKPGRSTAWDQALAQARRQLDLAAGHLELPVTLERVNLGTRPSSGLASRMDAAAFQLRIGRELLETHFESAPDGLRRHHSEWAAPLASPAVRTALVAEIVSIARQAADATDKVGRQSGWRATPSLRRTLQGASRRLRMASTLVEAAQQSEPLPAVYRDLLHDIPGSMPPPRRLPGTRDDLPYLRAGITASAQRTSRAGWQVAERPDAPVTITSMRQTAAFCVLVSHHCEILLRASAEMAAIHLPGAEVSREFEQATQAAGKTRESWMAVAHALSRVTTDKRGKVAQAAREAGDLALWTGRLAYANPKWTLASGPAHEPRPARDLIPSLADIPAIAASVHHAIDILEPLAAAGRDQARATAEAGRLLVPALSVPDAGNAQPLIPAPEDRVTDLVNRYGDAARAGSHAAAAMSAVAASVAAPSRSLTTARAATGRHRIPRPSRAGPAPRPGLLEASVRDLGITSESLISRAEALDRASEQLILEAAAAPGASYDGTPAITIGRSAAAVVVQNLLAANESRAAALLSHHEPQRETPESEIPEREP